MKVIISKRQISHDVRQPVILRTLKQVYGCRSVMIVTIIFFFLLTPCQSLPPKIGMRSSRPSELLFEEHLKPSVFPVSMYDFRQMVTLTTEFVDKTYFIKEIIDSTQKVMLITRPRGWGKTLNMNMLNYFFRQEVDQEGRAINPQPHRVLFEGGIIQMQNKNINLKPLKIAKQLTKDKVSCMDFQGTYPVIFMSLSDIQVNNHLAFKTMLTRKIRQIFDRHQYLLKSKMITASEIKQFNYYTQILDDNSQEVPDDQLLSCLQLLCQMLKTHHHKSVIILIDDYDRTFNFMLQEEIDPLEGKKVALTISCILTGLFKGFFQYVHKGILIGIFDTLHKQAGSGLNNLEVYRITNPKFNECFGFSRKEIEQQLILNMLTFVEDYEVVKTVSDSCTKWYNGYIIPLMEGNYKKIYNPFAVIKYLQACSKKKKIIEGESYWTESGSDYFLKKFFSFQNDKNQIGTIFSLDLIEPKPMLFVKNLSLIEMDTLKEQYLTHLLVNSGYITGKFIGKKESNVQQFLALIPNLETKIIFKTKFQDWLEKINFFTDHTSIDMENHEEFKEKMIKTFESTKDKIGRFNKKIFNSLFAFRYLVSDNTKHIVYIQVDSGEGYIGNFFYPKQNSNTAIIHQYKFTENMNEKNDLYQSALWQIYEKQYMNQPICRSKIDGLCSTIITRPIVIIHDIKRSIDIFMKNDNKHTIQESKVIADVFSRHQLANPQKQPNKQVKEQSRKKLLQQYQAKDIQDLLQKIIVMERKLQFKNHILDYDKVLNNLPYVNSRKKGPLITKIEEQSSYPPVFIGMKKISNEQQAKVQKQKKVPFFKSFRRKFPNAESLYDASQSQIAQAFLSQTQGQGQLEAIRQSLSYLNLAREVYDKLQQLKKDPSYWIPSLLKHDVESPNGTTIRQTLLVQPNLLRQDNRRQDQFAQHRIIKENGYVIVTEGQFVQSRVDTVMRRQALIDRFLSVDQKIVVQARHYERTGTMFSSLCRGLIDGTVRLFRFSLFGVSLGNAKLKFSSSAADRLILALRHSKDDQEQEGENKRMYH